MNPESVVDLTSRALKLVMVLAAPTVACAALLGLVIGVLQAVTQIQDQTIAQSIKLAAIMVVLALTAGWMGREIIAFSIDAINLLPRMAR